jgi:predicted nucleic acid-binding protein
MRAAVVDASALVAVLFEEPEATPIRASLRGPLIAPTLLRYELANACASRARRRPADAERIFSKHQAAATLRIEQVEPDWVALSALAQRWGLTAYDAAYLQVALAKRVPLITLDRQLAMAYDRAVALR